MPHAVGEEVGLEDGVRNAEVLCAARPDAVEHKVHDLVRGDKVAADGHLLQVDAQRVDAEEE